MIITALARLTFAIGLVSSAVAQTTKEDVLVRIDETKGLYEDIALKIWSYAEVGYQETRSTALLQERLRAEGFTIEAGVAGMPTAFTATYTQGTGGPVIGLLGEFDALPGVAQEAIPERKAIAGQIAGHACGHHVYGSGSAAAAAALKAWLVATGTPGTVRYYGCPAEEGGSGKVYLVRAGLFNDVDAVLRWHAGDRNEVDTGTTMANKSAKFRFQGVAAHAASAPERGRSALDAVEAMNYMANLMREHVPADTRIHYVITRGGEAPNVVPANAEVFYYVRNPRREVLTDVWARLEQAAQGAALGTDTKVSWEIIHGAYELLPNETLGRAIHANLERVGGLTYSPDELAFAQTIGKTFPGGRPLDLSLATGIQPFETGQPPSPNSTDSADVSWVVPTMGLNAATWVPGTPGHSWQAVASGGTTIALKGMVVAAKALALTGIDLFTQPELRANARAEFLRRRGADFVYQPLIGDRAPPLDYRK